MAGSTQFDRQLLLENFSWTRNVVLGHSAVDPTLLELAQLSEASYGSNETTRFTKTNITASGNGFSATAFEDGNQVVVAFSGTDPHNIGIFEDLYADGSFVNGTPTAAFELYVLKAVEFIAKVKQEFPNSQITLTGHSLGGAVAELIGDSTLYKAISFNAPGAKSLISALSGDLGIVTNLSGNASKDVKGYRLWGDQISLIGDHIGKTDTIHIDPAVEGEDLTFPRAWNDHLILTVIDNLVAGWAIEQDNGMTIGPKFQFNIIKGVGNPQIFSIANVDPQLAITFDPPTAGGYEFSLDSESPSLFSIQLPKYDNIFRYSIQYSSNNIWGSESWIDPLKWFYFQSDQDGFRLLAFDRFDQQVNFLQPLVFDLKFANRGDVTATLTALPLIGASVPESNTWMIFILGFGAIGIQVRRRRFVISSGVIPVKKDTTKSLIEIEQSMTVAMPSHITVS